MKINVKSTKLELTEAIRNYFQEKMDMLEKYFGSIKVINCDVEIEKLAGRQRKGKIFRAEVNLQVPGEILRVEKTADNMYKAIDKVKDHLELIIKKYKEKLIDRRKKQ